MYEMQDLVMAMLKVISPLDALAMHYQNVKLAAQAKYPIVSKSGWSLEQLPVAEAAIKVADLGLT
ncbi:hypothetical protein ACT691_17440 [Vibrio metschnikovii]